jgi:hypothetical protein
MFCLELVLTLVKCSPQRCTKVGELEDLLPKCFSVSLFSSRIYGFQMNPDKLESSFTNFV